MQKYTRTQNWTNCSNEPNAKGNIQRGYWFFLGWWGGSNLKSTKRTAYSLSTNITQLLNSVLYHNLLCHIFHNHPALKLLYSAKSRLYSCKKGLKDICRESFFCSFMLNLNTFCLLNSKSFVKIFAIVDLSLHLNYNCHECYNRILTNIFWIFYKKNIGRFNEARILLRFDN